MNLTKSFSLEELVKSSYAIRQGIANDPNDEQAENLRLLCINVLQPLRDAISVPIGIDSGFRNYEVNHAIGGAKNSQHTEGKAADIVTSEFKPSEVIKKVKQLNLPVDQAILEFDEWVHLSYNKDGNRNQFLYAAKIGGVTKYAPLEI
jgi:zinc D-Ala-D-Ala carboxypeptidase